MGYGYGSEWELTRMLGRHRQWFTDQISAATGLSSITWLDFCFDTSNWLGDAELLSLDFLVGTPVQEAFVEWWPHGRGIMNWDAVGSGYARSARETLVLVEAKGNFRELRSDSGAGRANLDRIHAALAQTQAALGVTTSADWTERYYQHANRLAVLHFLTHHDVPAVLVDVFFHGHTDSDARSPLSPDEWKPAIAEREHYLGLTGSSVLERRVFKVFVDISGDS